MDFKIQDQVIVRRPILHGRGSQLIKLGTILSMSADGKKAVVSFPADSTRVTIPINQLEPAKSRFARARVNIDPMRRQISALR
jgi:hypothetical protein